MVRNTGTSSKEVRKMQKAINFFKEAYSELQKSTWLNRKEVTQYTIVVFIVCFVVAIYVVAIDIGLAQLLNQILYK